MNSIFNVIRNNDHVKLQEILEHDCNHDLLYSPIYEVSRPLLESIIPQNDLTLLHVAAFFDSLECYILLLKQEGYSTRTQTPSSYYPIHYSCYKSSYNVFMYTLKIDPTIIQSYPEGVKHHYLFVASLGADPRILRELFERKIDITLEKDTLKQIITKVIHLNAPAECMHLFKEYFKLTNDYFQKENLPMLAIVNNNPEMLDYFVQSYDDIKFMSEQGESVFSLACFYGKIFKNSILRMLEFVKNEPIEPPSSIQCPGVCHWICMLHDLDVAKAMLKTNGVNINRLDKNGFPGIFKLVNASRNEEDLTIEFIRLLIENGFDINVRAPPINGIYNTESVLEKFVLCIRPNMKIIQFLIDYGADICALMKNKDVRLIDHVLKMRNRKLKEIFQNAS